MRKKDSPRFSLPASRAALKACKDYTASSPKEKTHSCLYGIGTHLTIGHILLLLCIFTTDTKIAGPSIMSPMPAGTRHRPIESISSDPASPVLDKSRGSRQTDGVRTEQGKGLGCASIGHIEQSQDGPACPAGRLLSFSFVPLLQKLVLHVREFFPVLEPVQIALCHEAASILVLPSFICSSSSFRITS